MSFPVYPQIIKIYLPRSSTPLHLSGFWAKEVN